MKIRKDIKEIIGFKEMKNNTVYFGNFLIFRRKKTKEFGRLKDELQARLEGDKVSFSLKLGEQPLL